MPNDNQRVKCRRCNVEAHLTVEDGEPKTVTCPKCGISRGYEEVLRLVGNQAAANATKRMQDALSRAFRPGRSGSVTFRRSPTPVNQPVGEFYIDLD